MQEKNISWGIIGCGDVTELKSGPAFNKVPSSKLHAVMRRNGDKAEDYARRHGVPRWYDDADALINDPEVNAVYIATPPLPHEEYALKAIAAGKPVYVEKPMTLDAASASRMKAAAEQSGVRLSVAHYRRQQPMFLEIKRLLQEQTIGDVRFAHLQMLQPANSDIIAASESNWRLDPKISGGGLFHDLAPHQLDLMVYFFGNPLQSSGIAVNQAGLYTADDLVTGHVLFERNVVFTGTWCFSVSKQDQVDICEIVGSEGRISFPIFGHELSLLKRGSEKKVLFEPLQHVQQPMIAKVVDYFLGKGENPSSAGDALLSMQLLDSFTASSD